MDGVSQNKPLWRAIWDFPLIALIVASLIMGSALFASGYGLQALVDGVEPLHARAIGAVVVTIVSVLLCKYVITHLGELGRDDLVWGEAPKDLALGTLGSAGLMSVIFAIVYVLGGYEVLGWGGMTSWISLLFLAGLQAGFVEEVIFRGIFFRYLEEFGGSWFALALTSAFFGFGHAGNDNATLLSSLSIAAGAGILLGGAYMLTRSLWLPIGIHFGWNVTQGFVWDVPVSGNDVDGILDTQPAGAELISGGAFGLEASLVGLFMTVFVGVVILVMAIRKGELMRPWWVRRRLAREAALAEAS
ncbi:lysostaphin resistance A-like protein [Erythrobacter sp. HA6-11]